MWPRRLQRRLKSTTLFGHWPESSVGGPLPAGQKEKRLTKGSSRPAAKSSGGRLSLDLLAITEKE